MEIGSVSPGHGSVRLERKVPASDAAPFVESPGDVVSPLVDVLMLAHNVEPFIRQAVEGVLGQRVGFPVRLIIAEDRSSDGTVQVCRDLFEAHPGRIHFIEGEENLGIAGRAAAGWRACRARYVAICDGDDRWTDPNKLADQVAILEADASIGMSYTDISLVDRNGRSLAEEGFDGVRGSYRDGEVFARLLTGNFIPNSTVVVRRSLLADHAIDTDRGYFIHDHLQWLHVAGRALVHFLPRRTTEYRQGGVTGSTAYADSNKRKLRTVLPELLVGYLQRPSGVPLEGRAIILRKAMGVLLRNDVPGGLKRRLVALLPRLLQLPLAGRPMVHVPQDLTTPTGSVINDMPA